MGGRTGVSNMSRHENKGTIRNTGRNPCMKWLERSGKERSTFWDINQPCSKFDVGLNWAVDQNGQIKWPKNVGKNWKV